MPQEKDSSPDSWQSCRQTWKEKLTNLAVKHTKTQIKKTKTSSFSQKLWGFLSAFFLLREKQKLFYFFFIIFLNAKHLKIKFIFPGQKKKKWNTIISGCRFQNWALFDLFCFWVNHKVHSWNTFSIKIWTLLISSSFNRFRLLPSFPKEFSFYLTVASLETYLVHLFFSFLFLPEFSFSLNKKLLFWIEKKRHASFLRRQKRIVG